jgi:hypothetical protein
MKFKFAALFAGLFLVSSANALNVTHKVDSPGVCPDSLQVKIAALNGKPDLFQVEILFLPEPGGNHSARVFNKLMVLKDGELLADAPLDVILDGRQFRSQFRLHRSALEQSKVTVSMYLVGGGDIPVLGGGQIYEISLKGFLVPTGDDDLKPGVGVPLIDGEGALPAVGQ